MARKTKEDAELTRQRIITAAREVFAKRGVSHTTMEHIATHAQVTRGAVYWHFANKLELFQAMRDQAMLPFIDQLDAAALDNQSEDPLASIEHFFCNTIKTLEKDASTRQTYEIMMAKCEYVGEFNDVLQQLLITCQGFIDKIQLLYKKAQQKGLIHPDLDPAALAMDTQLFFGGVLNMWIKDNSGLGYRSKAIDFIKQHIQFRRMTQPRR
ncbi:TetR family transcriptional regulator [Methylobacillus flagellatus]|uniref:Transcriptional regulator, TetR family n=1 Tax=Methylobacillus flagellatus (strain ATCC 51484 / DSM 6875 / VKM B-1610 / KT) TaxID=265072 RepID=Q1H0X5_METFK|nr:TetR family transcriptional regulator [Methylobacillus flagellatus]ABE49862.1 transcriptional regulator, TetR family [Methylobacillus flagellatus KT]